MSTENEEQGQRRRRRNGSEKKNQSAPIELAKTWCDGLFLKMNLDIQSEVSVVDGGILVDLQGPGTDAFVAGLGQGKGNLLHVLQSYLTTVLFARGEERMPITVDAGGYRQRRAESLQNLSNFLGDRVTAHGKTVTILGMNSFERRSVHTGLQADNRTKTESEGYGVLRRLKIQKSV